MKPEKVNENRLEKYTSCLEIAWISLRVRAWHDESNAIMDSSKQGLWRENSKVSVRSRRVMLKIHEGSKQTSHLTR